MLLLTAANAQVLEVGETRRIGVGIAAGYPPSGTVKFHLDRRNAVTLHAGPTLAANGLHTRVQFERWERDLKSWDFGVLGLTWHAGLVFNWVFGQAQEAQPVRPGVVAGAGVELRVVPFPVAAFAEVGPVLFPLDLLPNARFFPLGVDVVVGARVYLGRRKPSAPDESDVDPVRPPPSDGEIEPAQRVP